MTKFNPIQTREFLIGDVGFRWALGRDFAKSKSVGGLGSSASAYLNMAVNCILVGLDDAAKQLLMRAFEWLTAAIEEEEKPQAYGMHGTEAERFLHLSLCNWLRLDLHDLENLNRFVKHEDRFLVGSKIGRDKTNVSLTLLGYVDAGAYQQTLERFADAGLSVPKSLASTRNEGQMCNIICRHRLGLEYSEVEVTTATEKFLKRSVDNWLIDGHFLRAAHWMKVVHWREGKASLSAREAVLKCYNYLDIAQPTFANAKY